MTSTGPARGSTSKYNCRLDGFIQSSCFLNRQMLCDDARGLGSPGTIIATAVGSQEMIKSVLAPDTPSPFSTVGTPRNRQPNRRPLRTAASPNSIASSNRTFRIPDGLSERYTSNPAPWAAPDGSTPSPGPRAGSTPRNTSDRWISTGSREQVSKAGVSLSSVTNICPADRFATCTRITSDRTGTGSAGLVAGLVV